MRVALDTNILAYAEGVNGLSMKRAALDLVSKVPQTSVVLPVQALGELFHVLTRKAGRSMANAQAAVLSWRNAFELMETSAEVMLAAFDLVVNHQFAIWDAVIVCAAAEADCRILFSQDMQDGFIWKGMTVIDPFARSRHSLLVELFN